MNKNSLLTCIQSECVRPWWMEILYCHHKINTHNHYTCLARVCSPRLFKFSLMFVLNFKLSYKVRLWDFSYVLDFVLQRVRVSREGIGRGKGITLRTAINNILKLVWVSVLRSNKHTNIIFSYIHTATNIYFIISIHKLTAITLSLSKKVPNQTMMFTGQDDNHSLFYSMISVSSGTKGKLPVIVQVYLNIMIHVIT